MTTLTVAQTRAITVGAPSRERATAHGCWIAVTVRQDRASSRTGWRRALLICQRSSSRAPATRIAEEQPQAVANPDGLERVSAESLGLDVHLTTDWRAEAAVSRMLRQTSRLRTPVRG